MPKRPLVKCPGPGCTEMTIKGVRCKRCKSNMTRGSDIMRGNSKARGYGPADQWGANRSEALERDRTCQCKEETCDHVAGRCGMAAVVADHYPKSRRELVAMGTSDPNNARYLRGLCASCHSKATARNQPGGWGRRGYVR